MQRANLRRTSAGASLNQIYDQLKRKCIKQIFTIEFQNLPTVFYEVFNIFKVCAYIMVISITHKIEKYKFLMKYFWMFTTFNFSSTVKLALLSQLIVTITDLESYVVDTYLFPT